MPLRENAIDNTSPEWSANVRMYAPESCVCMCIIEGRSALVCLVAISSDGGLLAFGKADKTAQLWGASSLKCGGEKKAEAQVFACLAECDKIGLITGRALEMLLPLISSVSKLKLFHSFASAALRKGNIIAG